ncbi:Rpn family recombination-promoting nuclease/putative transposase [Niabella sp.]|uniref:Rpn family recombination-promoting nuclease/putative transposase n=1 Tax=Niabella sp. TaxID=1962976 RepID=UPI00260AE02F|nr:Rpn family recombination-promoting nuclease/putative transposase [Niabella sp.]
MKNTVIVPLGRYIDPLTDFGFKRIFASESHKDLLIAFLNALFQGRKKICAMVYNPQENNGPARHHRKTIFDLTCTGPDGETFIIEVQRAGQKFFTDRALFYTACRLQEQGPKGNKHWDFELKEVFFVGIMDFNFDHTSPGKYLHYVRPTEEETGNIFYNKLGLIFLELPNFNLRENDLNTDLKRWLYVLRNMAKLEKIPVNLHKATFQKLFKLAEVSNLKKEEYMLYQKDVLDKWTEYSVLKTAEEKGIAEGEVLGKAKGKAEVVANLITKFGFTNEQAVNAAEVSLDFVKKVRASLKKK